MSAGSSFIMRAFIRSLAVCPECGGPATFTVHPDGLFWFTVNWTTALFR